MLQSCAALVLAAVAGGALAAPRRPARAPPAWTRLTPGRCPVPFSPALVCAVGKVEGVSTELGRAAAATRARTVLAEAIRRGRVVGARAEAAGGGELREAAVTETLAGSFILATYRGRGGVWFALAAMDGPPPRGGRPGQ